MARVYGIQEWHMERLTIEGRRKVEADLNALEAQAQKK
jgi:hypothetical protein